MIAAPALAQSPIRLPPRYANTQLEDPRQEARPRR
jgi:hypothetical protein